VPVDVIKVGPLGPYANNAYILADHASKEAIFVDAPIDSQKALDAAKGFDVKRIVITHRHGDHWANIDLVRDRLGVPVFCHEADRAPYAAKVDGTVADNDTIAIGETIVRVLHTPGHTPGSICLLAPTVDGHDVLISGDTLFPGGPGRSDNNAALREMVASIEARLLPLAGKTAVLPGHGDDTTIANAQREHAVFASKQHTSDLHGDVTWEG
jgi:glyoxylase-like metal-dependent hydrolase (beta-lactamase superfamily II)